MTRLMIAAVVAVLGAACGQSGEDPLRGAWVEEDGTRIEFLDDNKFVQQPRAGREVEGSYEWLGPAQIRVEKNHPVYGFPLEMVTRTVVQVTQTELLLADEQGQVATFRRR